MHKKLQICQNINFNCISSWVKINLLIILFKRYFEYLIRKLLDSFKFYCNFNDCQLRCDRFRCSTLRHLCLQPRSLSLSAGYQKQHKCLPRRCHSHLCTWTQFCVMQDQECWYPRHINAFSIIRAGNVIILDW